MSDPKNVRTVHYIGDNTQLDLLTRDIPERRFLPACGSDGVTTAIPGEVTCERCRAIEDDQRRKRQHDIGMLDLEVKIDNADRPALDDVKLALDAMKGDPDDDD